MTKSLSNIFFLDLLLIHAFCLKTWLEITYNFIFDRSRKSNNGNNFYVMEPLLDSLLRRVHCSIFNRPKP